MYNKDFLKRMTKRAVDDKSVSIQYKGRKTFCFSLRTGKSGMSIRHIDDEPDLSVGVGLAYCRLKNIKVPKETEYGKLEVGNVYQYKSELFYCAHADDKQAILVSTSTYLVGYIIKNGARSVTYSDNVTGKNILFRLIAKNPKMYFFDNYSEDYLKSVYESSTKNRFIRYTVSNSDITAENYFTKCSSHNPINDKYSLEANLGLVRYGLLKISPYFTCPNVLDKEFDLRQCHYEMLYKDDKYVHCLNYTSKRVETLEKPKNYQNDKKVNK